MIAVTWGDGSALPEDAKIRWLKITPWVQSIFKTRVAVPGGDGLGYVESRGKDNAVCTLTGLVLWNGAGAQLIRDIAGAKLYVNNGIKGPIECLADSPQIVEHGGAVVVFSLTVTEV